MFKREIYSELIEWKHSKYRKPLILRGARQVGKTTLVNHFAKEFKSYISLNLEKSKDRSVFEDFDEVKDIVESLFISNGIVVESKDVLLFIDEIQESPKAISLLRYFYEEISELAVIATGSLLEFAFKDVNSFPVGRVEYRYLGPFSFCEFLAATGKEYLVDFLKEIPINKLAHQKLLEAYHTYALIGGMPEVIKVYSETKKVSQLKLVYESIWTTYKEDIEKYARNASERRVIEHLMNVSPFYLDKRIKFQNFGNSNYRSREVSEAFRLLSKARVIRLVYPTIDTKLPAQPSLNKSPRLQFIDTGIVNYALQNQVELMKSKNLTDAYRGAVVPHLMFQELISKSWEKDEVPFFWVREKRQSSAEVDLVRSSNERLIPIEIKSGKKGTLRSLHQFINESGETCAVRFYASQFSIEEGTTASGTHYKLLNLPYYLGSQIDNYLDYFLNLNKH